MATPPIMFTCCLLISPILISYLPLTTAHGAQVRLYLESSWLVVATGQSLGQTANTTKLLQNEFPICLVSSLVTLYILLMTVPTLLIFPQNFEKTELDLDLAFKMELQTAVTNIRPGAVDQLVLHL